MSSSCNAGWVSEDKMAKVSGENEKTKVKEEIKEEETEQLVEAPDQFQSAVQTLKAASGTAKVDCHLSGSEDYEVYEDYDCILIQTNIGINSNKFYVIQLITKKKQFYCWNRWGRVGELGQSKLSPFPNLADAQKDFEKKFKDKTKNLWSERENFTPHAGKYTMIEVQHDDEEEGSDIKKMPLGKLSKAQIAKGFEALDELQAALDRKADESELSDLCSQFYTIIPHHFERKKPPVIDTQEDLQAKKEMLLELADKVKKEEEEENVQEVPHPLDVDYGLLKSDLSLLETKQQ